MLTKNRSRRVFHQLLTTLTHSPFTKYTVTKFALVVGLEILIPLLRCSCSHSSFAFCNLPSASFGVAPSALQPGKSSISASYLTVSPTIEVKLAAIIFSIYLEQGGIL